MIKLSFVVFTCNDIEESRKFYEDSFGIKFTKENHDNGIEHYVANIENGVIELYSKTRSYKIATKSSVKIGFSKSDERFSFAVTDPDGNRILINK